MARVPLSKAERKNLKAQRRAGLSGGVMLDDFADDVADLVQVRLPGLNLAGPHRHVNNPPHALAPMSNAKGTSHERSPGLVG